MGRWRLGVVLLLPQPVANEIDGLRRALGGGGLSRMVPHITLVPPVNVRSDAMETAINVVRSTAALMQPFAIDLGPVQTFLPVSPTLKLNVGGPGLVMVHALRDAVFQGPLERTLTFPFVPHVTLADELNEVRTQAALRALVDYQTTVTVDRVWIMRESEGRQWQPVVDAVFAQPTIAGRGGRELELSITTLIDPVTAGVCGVDMAAVETNLVVTARMNNVPVGVIGGTVNGGAFFLTTLAVVENERRLGIGGQLLRAVIDHCRATGVLLLHNQTDISNAFFSNYGFTPTGVLLL